MSSSSIEDFKATQQAKAREIAVEQKARVDFVKEKLKPLYDSAKRELPGIKKAVAEAAEFLQTLGQVSNIPASVVDIINRMAKHMEFAEPMVVNGIRAYENLKFHQAEDMGYVNSLIRDQLFGCDGTASFLKDCRGSIENILRAMSEATYNREGQILTTEPPPVRTEVKVESDFQVYGGPGA